MQERHAEEWFRQYAETKLKTQTVRCYHNCEKKVYKALGHLRMDKITTRTIQTFIVDLAGEKRYGKGKELPPYTPKTVRNYISFISSMFDYAVKIQVLSGNASVLINNDVDVKTVQSCLGHSSATTTLNIYAHSFQEAQARAMDSVANCILGKQDNIPK